MSRTNTEPFKVTCYLRDGQINSADGIIALDAILYHAWFAKYAPEVLIGVGNERRANQHFGLPLRQLPDNRYAASCGFYTQYEEYIEHWTKRPNFVEHEQYLDAGNAAKINTTSGPERAYRMPNLIRLIGPMEFYGYGSIDKVRELLAYIPAIGKKPAMGWGCVERFTIEPFPEDWTTWSPQYGLMRPMPVDEYDGADKCRYAIREAGVRPPYWKAAMWKLCYVPEVAIIT